jgi:hypothetical protein
MTNMQATDGDVVEVAHESPIRPWPTLCTWPETHQTNLLLRESVREAALERGHHARDEHYLPTGESHERRLRLCGTRRALG